MKQQKPHSWKGLVIMDKHIEMIYVKGTVTGYMFKVDSAVSMHDMDITLLREHEVISLNNNDEYKYCIVATERSAEVGEPICWCSKDAKEWFPCVTAFIGNDSIDLIALQERLIEAEPDDDLQKVFDEAIERDWEDEKTD